MICKYLMVILAITVTTVLPSFTQPTNTLRVGSTIQRHKTIITPEIRYLDNYNNPFLGYKGEIGFTSMWNRLGYDIGIGYLKTGLNMTDVKPDYHNIFLKPAIRFHPVKSTHKLAPLFLQTGMQMSFLMNDIFYSREKFEYGLSFNIGWHINRLTPIIGYYRGLYHIYESVLFFNGFEHPIHYYDSYFGIGLQLDIISF